MRGLAKAHRSTKHYHINRVEKSPWERSRWEVSEALAFMARSLSAGPISAPVARAILRPVIYNYQLLFDAW